MEHDEETVDTQDETQESETDAVEETEAETGDETVETVTPPAEERLTYEQKLARATTPEEKFAIADAEANKNRRLLNKKPLVPAKKPMAPQSPSSRDETDERILLANGMPKDLIRELKKVAKLNETGLIEAQTDTIFVAVKEKFESDKKKKNASLSPSRRSAEVQPKKDFSTPKLSREEHMNMVQSLDK